MEQLCWHLLISQSEADPYPQFLSKAFEFALEFGVEQPAIIKATIIIIKKKKKIA